MADLIVEPPLLAEAIPFIDRDGRNVAVVIAKAAFEITPHGLIGTDPLPLVVADEMYGPDPAAAIVRIPSDICDSKPAADILVIAPAEPLENTAVFARRIGVEFGQLKIEGSIGKTWTFGAVRRDASPRKKYVGTYDGAWAADRMPLLPKDFDPRYHQAAPPNQVAPALLGNESFRISNLYDQDRVIDGHLPGRTVLVIWNVGGKFSRAAARLDTVCVFVEKPLLTLTWRLAIPTRRAVSEISTINIYFPRLQAARELYGVP